MPHSSLVFALFSLASLLYGSNAQQRPPASACTDRYANTRLHCAVPIKSCPETASEQACAEECMNLPNCASALYTIDTRLCELYDIAKVPTRFRRSQQLLNRFRRQDDSMAQQPQGDSMAQQPQDDSPNGPLLNDFGDPYATTIAPSGPSPQGTTCYGQGPFTSSCAGYTYFIKQAGRYGCNNPVTYGPPVTNPPVTNPPVTNPPTNPPPPPATTTRATPATTKATQATTKPVVTTTPSRSTRAVTTASTTGFVVIPGGVTCQVDESVRFLKVDGKRLSDTPDTTFTAQSEAECYTACGNNKLPSGQQAPCQSVSFDKTTMSCGISTNAATPTGTGRATDDPNSVYYEKFCIKKSDEGSCPATFLVDPQHVLVGFARAVVTTNTEGECLNECLNSVKNFGFVCLSGMFFSQDSQCVLNTESRTTQPDLYTPENQDVVDYFEPGCTQAPPITGDSFPPRVGAGLGGQQNDNAPQEAPSSTKGKGSILSIFNKNLANDTWGQWTACDRRSNTQKRFKGCTRMSPKSCQDQQEHKCEQRAQKTRTSHKKHPRRQSRDTPINQEVSGANSIGPVLTPMLSRNMDPLIIEGSGESKATATSTQGPEAISTLQIPSNIPEAAVSDAGSTGSASMPSQVSSTSTAFQESPVPDVVRDVPAIESTKPEAVSDNPKTQKSMLSAENQIESSSERISRADAKSNGTEKPKSAETPSPTISPGLANVTAVINFWLPKEQWAPWTPCDKRTATQRRFRACNTMNPNSCGYHEQQKNCTYHDETAKNVTSTTPTLPRSSTPSTSDELRNATSTSRHPLLPPAMRKVGHSIRDQLSRQQRLEPDNSLLVGFERTDTHSSNETEMLIPPADLVDISDYQDFPKVNRSKPSAPSPPNKGPIPDPHSSINGSIPVLIPPTLLPPLQANTTTSLKESSTTKTSSATKTFLLTTATRAPSNQFEFEITTASLPDIALNNETTPASTDDSEPTLPGNFTLPTPAIPGAATLMTSSAPPLSVSITETPAKMPPGPTAVTSPRPTSKSPGAAPSMPIDPIDFMQTRSSTVSTTTTDQSLTDETAAFTSPAGMETPPSPPQRSTATTTASVLSADTATSPGGFNSSVANNLPGLSTIASPAETETTDETTETFAVTDDISAASTKSGSVTTSPAILGSTLKVTGTTSPQSNSRSDTQTKSTTTPTKGSDLTTATTTTAAQHSKGASAAASSVTTAPEPTLAAGSSSPGGITYDQHANVTMATTIIPLSTKAFVRTTTTTTAVSDQHVGVDVSSPPQPGATYGATAKTAETTAIGSKVTMTTAATTKALLTTAATSKASMITTTATSKATTTTATTTSKLPTTTGAATSKGMPTQATVQTLSTSTSKTSTKTAATTLAPKAGITEAQTTTAHISIAPTTPKAVSEASAHPTYGSISRLPLGQAQQESTTAKPVISPAPAIGSAFNKTKPVEDGSVTKMPGTSGENLGNGTTDSISSTTVSPLKYTPIINALLPPAVWGPWAACDRRTAMQMRYRGCKRMSPNSCAEHETRSCEFDDGHSLFNGNFNATILPPTPMPDKAVAVRLYQQ